MRHLDGVRVGTERFCEGSTGGRLDGRLLLRDRRGYIDRAFFMLNTGASVGGDTSLGRTTLGRAVGILGMHRGEQERQKNQRRGGGGEAAARHIVLYGSTVLLRRWIHGGLPVAVKTHAQSVHLLLTPPVPATGKPKVVGEFCAPRRRSAFCVSCFVPLVFLRVSASKTFARLPRKNERRV